MGNLLENHFTTTFIGLLLYLVHICEAGEYCGYYDNYGIYTMDYCDGYCCSNEYDNCCSNWGWIAGVVVGAIVFISVVGVIIFMICVKMKAKKTRTVNVVSYNNSSQQQAYSNAHHQPYKPHHTRTGPPGYPQPPPPYTETYNQGAAGPYGAYPPPPPYSGPMTSQQPMTSQATQPTPGYSGMQTTTMNAGDPVYPPPPTISN